PGLVSKKHKPISTLRSVDESVVEDVPKKEQQVDDDEADVQRALEESLKSMYDVPRGPFPLVVIREPESRKYQPLPEVSGKGKEKWSSGNLSPGNINRSQRCRERAKKREPESRKYQPLPEVSGKGKEKVIEEQVARDLLTIQTPKKKSPADRYIFQRRTSTPIGSFGHDESSSLYAELGLTDSEEEYEEVVSGADAGGQADNDKANADTEAESMVSVTIQQDMSSIPLMITPTIDLTSRPESTKVHQLLKATATETTKTTTTILPPPSQQQQSTTDAMMMKRIGDLEHIMANLIQENKKLEQRLDSHGARLYTLEELDIPRQVSKAVDEVVTDAIDLAMQAPLRNRFRDLPEADMKEILHQQKSMNRDHSEELAKDMAEARKKKKKSRETPKMLPGSPPHQPPPHPPPADLQMDDDIAFDEQAQSSDDEDIENAHILKVNLRQDWWKPLEEERPTTLEPAWSISSSDVPVLTNNWASALASNYSPPPEDLLLAQTGDITMFMNWFCKRRGITELKPQDLEGPAFEIIKVFHPDECKYDIAAMYDISHWWFQRQRFYIDRHTSEGDRRAVRTHMRILSVVRIKVYGYDYMKKIVLRRADLNEHVIAERDFKYLYPSDFKDLYMLNLQGPLNHLPPKDKKILATAINLWTRHLVIRQRVEDFQLGIGSYQTQLNLTKPRWDATGFEYKHDYTIDKALDYRVKKFKINRMNPGLNTRFLTRKDVDRSKKFMFAIQKRLKIRRIFRNLESFVGGRVRYGDYRLLKLTE
nr:hypothetical protein [Tanacetum cinerariifolium]